MTSPFFQNSSVESTRSEHSTTSTNPPENIIHTNVPADFMRNILEAEASSLWPKSIMDWKFDTVNNSDSAPRLINVIGLPLGEVETGLSEEQSFKLWNNASVHTIEAQICACKFDLAQCYRMLIPNKYRNLYNVRRSLIEQSTNKPIPELKCGIYASLQYVEEEKGNDKSFSSKPMMNITDILNFMSSDFVMRGNSLCSKEFGFLKMIKEEQIQIQEEVESSNVVTLFDGENVIRKIETVQKISQAINELKRKRDASKSEELAPLDQKLKRLKMDAEIISNDLLLTTLKCALTDGNWSPMVEMLYR